MSNLRRHREPTRAIIVRLPETLVAECAALGLDASTGKVRHGFWARAVEYGLRVWLKEQKVRAA